MDFGTLFDTLLVHPMMAGLMWLAGVTGSAGLAIIIFTVLIRGLMLPLGVYQSKSQKAMMAVQPELKAIQKKYAKDRERLTQETMRLYKEHGVNPASGCLPMVLQLPVFYGLYWALTNLGKADTPGAEAFQAPFLWLASLAHPDVFHLPFDAGLAVPALPGILPLFMAGSQYFMSKMMQMPATDPQMQSMNRMMTMFMPLMLLFFGVNFPSGLVLYWAVSNVFSVVQQGFVTGWGPLLPSRQRADGVVPNGVASGLAAASTEVAAEPALNGVDQPRRSVKTARGARGRKRGKR
ncbi:MAG: membrane protein insertase YidC [Chloroflexi bacterium]|nr:membrane protein insertase YidC [Chloroflexota bacterium]